MVAGYTVGIGFLSRSYVVPTYMISASRPSICACTPSK